VRVIDKIGRLSLPGSRARPTRTRLAARRCQASNIGETWERVEKAAKAGQQQADVDAPDDQFRRQCRGDIAEPADLTQG
jgi:hypothetical protein